MSITVTYPPRSDLFHLPPEGVDTEKVESISSYVNRLAEEHRVSVKTVITDKISQKLSSEYCGPSVLSGRSYTAIGAHNGIGAIAEQWITALTELTLRSNLDCLSLIKYRNILTSNNLIRAYKAWCPQCLEEMRKVKRVYEPLLWKIEAVSVCPVHHQRLETKCPDCGRQPDHLAPRSRNGFCSRNSCGRWLGSDSDLSVEDHEIREEMAGAVEVGNLLAMAPTFDVPPSKEFIPAYITALIDNHARGNITGFAKIVGVSRESASDWKNGIHLPRLHQLLKMSFVFNDSISNRLREWNSEYGASGGGSTAGGNQSTTKTVEIKSRQLSEKSRKAEELLKDIVKGQLPPLPIKSIAEQCGCHQSLLYMHFGELCREVTKIRKHWAKQFFQVRNEFYMDSLVDSSASCPGHPKYHTQRSAKRLLGISSMRLLNELYAKRRLRDGKFEN